MISPEIEGLLMKTAAQSTCQKLKVGAIVMKDGFAVSTGYNKETFPCDNVSCHNEQRCVNTQHAEITAMQGLDVQGLELVVNYEPCYLCRKAIIHAGIKRVYYLKEYSHPLNEKFTGDVEWIYVSERELVKG